MRLDFGNWHLLVDDQGASIVRCQYRDDHVLWPQQYTYALGACAMKHRGGLHACVPNFGPPPEAYPALGPDKHGFMRNVLFHAIERVELEDCVVGRYKLERYEHPGFPWLMTITVVIRVFQNGFSYTVEIMNASGNPELMPVYPALHPYFAVPTGIVQQASVTLGEAVVPFERDEITRRGAFGPSACPVPAGMQLIPSLRLPGLGEVTMVTNQRCPFYVLWSDDPRYLCVEPVFAEYESFGKLNGLYLEQGETFTAELTVLLSPEH